MKRQQLERLAPFIQRELRKQAFLGAVSPPAALRQIFTALHGSGDRSSQKRRLFLSVAAPLVRRVAIELAPADERFGACEISVADFGAWLAQLDTFDSTTAKIIDLHCFAGASLKETAAMIGLPTLAVSGALRATLATLKWPASSKTAAAEMEQRS